MDKVEKSFLEYFQIEKIDDNTIAIKEDKIGYKANCFLLLNKGEGILIDALSGVYQGFIDSLEHIFNVWIRKLYLTHAHYDHFGGYDKNKIEEVYVSKYELNNLKNYYLTDEYVQKEMLWDGTTIFPSNFDVSNYKVKKIPNAKIVPKQIIFGKRTLEVIETPGHSKGSISFYDITNRYLFTGDFLYEGDIDLCEDPTSSKTDYLNSLMKIINLDFTKLLCGHNESTINLQDFSLKDFCQKVQKIISSKAQKYQVPGFNVTLLLNKDC